MQIIQPGVPFTFSYGAYDQAQGLYIAASIYDMTSGSPLLVGLIPMTDISYGVYVGNYKGSSEKVYLVIMASYTSNTFGTIDNTRPPAAECYQGVNRSLTSFSFNYATYDLNTGLYVAANIYNNVMGYVTKVDMQHVSLGVYYGAYNNVSSDFSYYTIAQVYTSNTYLTVDSSRTPSNDTYQGPIFSELQFIQNAPNIIGVVDGIYNPLTIGQNQITLVPGESRNFVIKILQQNLSPYDSTNLTDIQVHFKKYDGTALILSLSSLFGGITAMSLDHSIFSCNLTVEQSQELKTGEQNDFTVYLYFGLFSTGSYSGANFTASNPGSAGNVTITFDGVTDINTTLQEYNNMNPYSPSILLVSGAVGTAVLPAGSLVLSGGTNNNRIVNLYRALNIRPAII
jgi:hypothetical protein